MTRPTVCGTSWFPISARVSRTRRSPSWSVAVGDDVELNQTLCTVETNKAEVEIPSPYAGPHRRTRWREGETLHVGAVLVRIATDAPAPAALRAAETQAGLVGYGTDDEMDASRRTPVADGTGRAPSRRCASWPRTCTSTWPRLTPGSGPDGIVTRDDVLAVGGHIGAQPRHRRRAWCAGGDGASNVAVAQRDS